MCTSIILCPLLLIERQPIGIIFCARSPMSGRTHEDWSRLYCRCAWRCQGRLSCHIDAVLITPSLGTAPHYEYNTHTLVAIHDLYHSQRKDSRWLMLMSVEDSFECDLSFYLRANLSCWATPCRSGLHKESTGKYLTSCFTCNTEKSLYTVLNFVILTSCQVFSCWLLRGIQEAARTFILIWGSGNSMFYLSIISEFL